jgi:cysteine synthase
MSSWLVRNLVGIGPKLVVRVQVTRGVMYTKQEAEGKRLKNPFDTITEGIGINRQTANFSLAHIDGAFQGTDREAVEMVRCVLPTAVALEHLPLL